MSDHTPADDHAAPDGQQTSAGAAAQSGGDPRHPFTLSVDIGGTGLKASVLDADGLMVADRVRTPTTYPLPPDKLVTELTRLVAPLPAAERASAGFPGMVRNGKVLSAPHFSCKGGPAVRSTPSWPPSGIPSIWPPP